MTAAEAAAWRLINIVRDAGATMTIISGERSATIGAERSEGKPVSTMFADTETGEIVDVKGNAARSAERLIEVVWTDVTEDYPNLTPLMALEIAQKMVTAVLGGVVKEHAKILAEPFRPQQTKMDI